MESIRICLISLIVGYVVSGGGEKGCETPITSDVINRLPRDLIPFHYDLSIRPDISSSPPFPSSGNVTIHLECVKDTDVLVLNAIELKIDLKSIKITTGQHISRPTTDPEFSNFEEFPLKNELHFKVKNNFKKNFKYVFHASFTGVMSKTGEDGLYWDSYTGLDGSIKYIAATQLESIDARRMFPCFDEVDMKSTFNISVQRSNNHVAISNMPKIKSLTLSNGWVEDYFESSPIMSTYLVCIVVGDFKQVLAPTPAGSNITISLYATELQVKNLEYMKNFAVTKLQKWFDDHTGYPYREPKMDHVALPSKSGAMENWGIITYSEEMLCVDKETTSIVGKFNGVTVVSHELAHMWYGNLLTCKWWNELWIQEGFATHYNYNPTDYLGWEWMQTQQSDARRGVQSFMLKDQKNTTETVRKHIDSPQTSELAFTTSTYNKGGAIVRTIQGILSQPTLNTALTKYLKNHAYKNVGTQDLAESLNEQARLDGITYPNKSPLDFNKILDPWLNQIGYPLVKVERLNQSHVEASQKHYLHPYNQIVLQPSKFNYQWEIPMTKVTKFSSTSDWDKTPTDWIHVNETSKILLLSDTLRNWYIINPRQHFYYRVLYDFRNRRNLIEQLVYNHEVIPPETRSQLIDDNFDLARNLYIPAIEALDFTEYLSSELTYNPWAAALKHFHFVAPFFEQDHYYPLLQAYFRKKLDKILDHIGYGFLPDESVLDSYLRKDAIAAACSLGSKMCLTLVRSLYWNYISNPEVNSVNANVLPTVLCQGIFESSEKEWEVLYNQYNVRKYSKVKDERYAYILALTCTKDSNLLDRLFDDIVNGKIFPSKDEVQAAFYLADTKYGADILWKYLDENWNKHASAVIDTITNKWFTLEQLKKLQSFINNRKNLTVPDRERLTQNLLQVKLNIKFYELNYLQINNWINIRSPIDDMSGGYIDSKDTFSPAKSAHLHWSLLQDIYDKDIMSSGRHFE